MKVALAFLLFGLTAFAEEPLDHEQGKPAILQDGSAAQSYISKALYEYLEKPPYLAIDAETPFFSKSIDGKTMWIALVEFCCGISEQKNLHGLTVIAYDPVTKTHQFINPGQIAEAPGDDAI